MRRKRYSRGMLYKAVVAALFVAAQTTVLSHLDIDGHSQEAPCAICLSISTFGGANVASVDQIPSSASSAPRPDFQAAVPAARYAEYYLARAPPFVS